MHILRILTDVLPGNDVPCLTGGNEIVHLVINLETSDTTIETRVKPDEVFHVLYISHSSEVESLIEGYP